MALTLFSNTHLHSIRVHRRTQAYVNVLSSNEALKVKVMEIKKMNLSVSRMIMTFWTGFKLNRQN
jgi:hypothetical protein